MKNKREYFDVRAWKLRRDEIMRHKYRHAEEIMHVAAREKLEAEIGEPVNIILKFMKEDPRRFEIVITSRCVGYDLYGKPIMDDVRQSTDKRTGHKIKVSKSERPCGISLSGVDSRGDIYSEENNPWMTHGERLAIYNAIGGISEAIRLQEETARLLASIKRKEEGRSRVMEMYKREMK